MIQKIRLPIVALVIKATQDFITGKFETLGSNFSHETAGLLASTATIPREVYIKIFSKLKNSPSPHWDLKELTNQNFL